MKPGSVRSIDKEKIKAFNVGVLPTKGMTAKEKEKKRQQEEEEALAKCYSEFSDTFEAEQKRKAAGMSWIRGGVVEVGKGEKAANAASKLYKPKSSRLKEEAHESRSEREKREKWEKEKAELRRKNETKKKTSNLEAFKEELRREQIERQQRRAAKEGRISEESGGRRSRFDPPSRGSHASTKSADSFDDYSMADNDPHTTNLYIGSIALSITGYSYLFTLLVPAK